MANITMLDIEGLRKTKLRPYIDKCLEHRAPDPAFHAGEIRQRQIFRGVTLAQGSRYGAHGGPHRCRLL